MDISIDLYMITVLILAAGKSKRFGRKNKLLLLLHGKPILKWSLDVFQNHPLTKPIFITPRNFNTKSRQESIYKMLQKIKKLKPEFLLIHNAANPFVTEDEIFRCAYFLQKHRTIDGVGVGHKVMSTVKMILPGNIIQETLDRNTLWQMETPQLVRFKPFYEAHKKAKKEKFVATDDLAILEWAGKKTAVIEASPNNFKITTPRDYELAKVIVGDVPDNVRVGMAEDTHVFSRTHRGLRLGGVLFPKFSKLEANSDGDVCLHAVASAISQALGEGSLGTFADRMYKQGIKDSRKYLQHILKKVEKQNLKIQHLGLHFEGQQPKIDPLTPSLKISLSKLLNITDIMVGITAETGENISNISNVSKNNGLRCVATISLKAGNLSV